MHDERSLPRDPELLPTTRAELMALHAAARERREAAPLGSEAFREAAEEIARIEVAIAAAEEPPPTTPGAAGSASDASRTSLR